VKEKVRLISDVPAAVDFLLKEELDAYDDEALAKVKAKPGMGEILMAIGKAFEAVPQWSADAAKAAVAEVAASHGTKAGQLMFPLRVALSGRGHGPDIGDVLEILGREQSGRRAGNLGTMLS
jgi:glutamyl-tRNA synthetase